MDNIKITNDNFHKYALDFNKKIVHIDCATPKGEYYCPNCEHLMIVKNKGKIRGHHFSHKTDSFCSYESYVHKCAKFIIKQRFEENENFIIKYNALNTCNLHSSCKLVNKNINYKCVGEYLNEIDLKKHFDKCEIESSYKQFKADIKLTSSSQKNSIPLFIEICVTHPCTEEKVNSKIRIIELWIKSLDDIPEILKENNDTTKKPIIKFYNFKKNLTNCWEYKIEKIHLIYSKLIKDKASCLIENAKCDDYLQCNVDSDFWLAIDPDYTTKDNRFDVYDLITAFTKRYYDNYNACKLCFYNGHPRLKMSCLLKNYCSKFKIREDLAASVKESFSDAAYDYCFKEKI